MAAAHLKSHFDSAIKNWNLANHEHITHDKSRARGKDNSYNKQREINTTNNKRKVENKERLGLCDVRDLDPRSSKDKLLKLKGNRPNRRCERDSEEGR